MKKNTISVKISGKEYTISGFDSEENVRRVAAWVDRSMNELAVSTHLPPNELAVLTAVNAADRMIKSEDEITRLRSENPPLRALLADPEPEK